MKKTTNLVWGGRFEYDSSDILKRINNSISFDYNLAHQDIKLNKQYAKSLFKAKILSVNELKKINVALDDIQLEVKKKRFERDIEIIFVSVDANPTKVIPKFLKKNELENFDTYIDKKLTLTKELKVKVMPTTLVITKGPYELSRVEGYIDWLNKELLTEFEKIL